ncbi:hypothetical protein ACE1B6_18675 [Aerosakkonemataceae cyanobacterium BLCC-F154]|uniref:Uncharacterized protein n=1 Tax=Floridaenema fluviatile BLCC-F154 TaxID=3153640 RepID=A0ABV4YEL5_9CYAN
MLPRPDKKPITLRREKGQRGRDVIMGKAFGQFKQYKFVGYGKAPTLTKSVGARFPKRQKTRLQNRIPPEIPLISELGGFLYRKPIGRIINN